MTRLAQSLAAALAVAAAAPALADKTEGVIPGVLLAPKLGIVNFPTPTVGAEARIGRWVGLSFDYGLVPDITISNVTVSWKNWYLGARLHPFQGSFFVGALYGHRSFDGSALDAGADLEGTAEASSDYVAPVLGWRWVWDSGLALGLDLGWQFVTSHSESIRIPAGFDAGKAKDLRDYTDRIGTYGLPVLGLLQLLYYF